MIANVGALHVDGFWRIVMEREVEACTRSRTTSQRSHGAVGYKRDDGLDFCLYRRSKYSYSLLLSGNLSGIPRGGCVHVIQKNSTHWLNAALRNLLQSIQFDSQWVSSRTARCTALHIVYYALYHSEYEIHLLAISYCSKPPLFITTNTIRVIIG